MLNLNVIGRLTKDASPTQNEKILGFNIAANFYDGFKKENDVTFIRAFLDKNVQQSMHQFLLKGRQFFFSLTVLELGVFNDKPSITVRVNSIDFCGSKTKENNSDADNGNQSNYSPSAQEIENDLY